MRDFNCTNGRVNYKFIYIYRNYLIFKQLLTLKLNILQNVEIDRFVLFDTEKKKN